jgi:DNA mismatch repair protein MutS2
LRDMDFSTITDYGDISKYMDYNLIEVKGEMGVPEDAIKIARIMGIPEEIVTQAEQIMKNKYKS